MKKAKDIGRVFALLFFAIIFIVAISGQANADVTYYFGSDNMFGTPPAGGGVAPAGTWATATFMDVTGGVQLTLNVTNNLTAENIGEFYFNYSGDTSSLTIDPQPGGGSTAVISKGNNSFQADGDGLYDLLFAFPPPPGQFDKKFTAGETVIYDITGTGVSASSFYELAAPSGGNGPYYAAAKLQGIACTDPGSPTYGDCGGTPPTTSAWAAGVVPEPVSSTLFIVGAATLGFRRFRKKFKA
jgi:hypothetical protein